MKASELRVGNFIRFNNLIQPEEIITINPRFFCSAMCNKDFDINGYYKPIPLTEEWLLKFGFKKENTLHDGTSVYNGTPYLYFKDGYARISIKTPDIEYVHQLQNLYFSLTGEELSL